MQREGTAAFAGALHGCLLELQDALCAALAEEDGAAEFGERRTAGAGGTLARPRVLEDGAVFEKAAVNFTHSRGDALPSAASERRPELAGAGFEAVSLSLIAHPQNPYVPTVHMNLRGFFSARGAWWLGGGMDLTPCYGFDEDCVHWHAQARAACAPLPGAHPRFKRQCDEYFVLHHRGEARGIGGIFFDDLDAPDWPTCFALLQTVGAHFLPGYMPIVRRRRTMKWGERQREFQLWRRGRYAEFNLIWDRGTRYGLQSGRNTESVLASLPPRARWCYDFRPAPGSPEAALAERYLQPRDWLTP